MRLMLVLSMLLIGTQGSFGQKLKFLSDPSVDFARYKTYEWLPGRVLTKYGLADEGPEVTPAVKASVNGELQSRGFQEVPSGADIQVSYWALTESNPQVEAVLWTTWISPIDSSGVGGIGGNPIVVGRYNHKGTLTLNLIDPKTKKSLWAFLCTDTVDTPADVRKKVPRAVTKAFAKFPVKPSK